MAVIIWMCILPFNDNKKPGRQFPSGNFFIIHFSCLPESENQPEFLS